MSRISSKDSMLLAEAYNLQLLKEQAPSMTLTDVKNRLSLMNESELQYIITVNDRILNEFFGGLKALGGAAAQGAKNVASGVKNAAGQIANNVSNMYQAGNANANQGKLLQQAQQSVDALTKILQTTDQAGLLGRNRGQFMNWNLTNIINALQKAQGQAGQNLQNTQQQGFTGGVGQAFQQGMAGQV